MRRTMAPMLDASSVTCMRRSAACLRGACTLDRTDRLPHRRICSSRGLLIPRRRPLVHPSVPSLVCRMHHVVPEALRGARGPRTLVSAQHPQWTDHAAAHRTDPTHRRLQQLRMQKPGDLTRWPADQVVLLRPGAAHQDPSFAATKALSDSQKPYSVRSVCSVHSRESLSVGARKKKRPEQSWASA